jgi:thymidylate kinase
MSTCGQLYVFEGPDGVGKSTIARRLVQELATAGVDCAYMAFPGHENGTLGKHIYELHHNAQRYGIQHMSSTSLQLLHIVAHIDTIENRIIPTLRTGQNVVLDRFWWSTKVYGLVAGVNQQMLDAMINLELQMWEGVQPAALFLICRLAPLRPEPIDQWQRWCDTYAQLATEEGEHHPIYVIDNNGSFEDTMITMNKVFKANVASHQRHTPGGKEQRT